MSLCLVHLRRLLFARLPSTSLKATIHVLRPAKQNSTITRPLLLCLGFGSTLSSRYLLRVAYCNAQHHPMEEDPWLLVPKERNVKTSRVSLLATPLYLPYYLWRIVRKLIRCVSLLIRFGPLILCYPLFSRVDFLREFWWRWLLFTVQSSGPTFIKLGQWGSTRRDIFSKEFCDRLSILHTKTKKKRLFRDSDKVLDEVYGEGFMKKHKNQVFKSIDPYSVGSGCIAQVYRATINVPEFEKAINRKVSGLTGCEERQIAIKVADKNVENQIELDLSILRTTACVMQKIMPRLSYLDPIGAIEQFEMVLRRQVDLRNEARALMKFSENFDPHKTGVRFPLVLGYTKTTIVETFEDGIYINRLVAEEGNPELKARQSKSVRRRIALMGARALLKMIFVDNFIHGDLHPGNILIRFNDNDTGSLPGVHKAPPSDTIVKRGIELFRSLIRWRSAPKIRFTDSPDLNDDPTLILLDTGIAISETPKNLANFKALFRMVVEKKGYEAGRLLLTHSPNEKCREPDAFCKEVEGLVAKARSEKSLRTLNISALLSEMFSIVAKYHVELDSSFTTVFLSVMVLEGFGRSLDPDLDLFQCARPYLLNVLV